MFDTDTIIITVIAEPLTFMTIFHLEKPISSDSLEKDQFLLSLTRSTFLNLSSSGVISDISRETP